MLAGTDIEALEQLEDATMISEVAKKKEEQAQHGTEKSDSGKTRHVAYGLPAGMIFHVRDSDKRKAEHCRRDEPKLNMKFGQFTQRLFIRRATTFSVSCETRCHYRRKYHDSAEHERKQLQSGEFVNEEEIILLLSYLRKCPAD